MSQNFGEKRKAKENEMLSVKMDICYEQWKEK